jgi:glutathione synthetase
VNVAPAFNLLVDRVSRDAAFLEQTLGGGVSDTDPYTAKILKLYQQVYGTTSKDNDSPAHSADRLGIHRSDYMLHKEEDDDDSSSSHYQLKQVELNTIAASFAGLSSQISNLHRYLASRFPNESVAFLKANQKIVTGSDATDAILGGVPENPALTQIPLGMKVAYDRYVTRFSQKDDTNTNDNVIILFVVQEGETNTVDQRMLEFRLWEDYGIPVVRMSLTKAATALTLDETTGALTLLLGKQEAAVIYYRAGYAPTDYPDGDDGVEWQARLRLEQSRAAKCPSLGYHLAGTKKVQQELEDCFQYSIY